MGNTFVISPLTDIRMVPIKDFDDSIYSIKPFYESFGFEDRRYYQQRKQYSQMFNLADNPTIQLLSSYTEITGELRNVSDNSLVSTLTLNAIDATIKDRDFLCYQFSVPFTSEGQFYVQIKYNSTPLSTPTYLAWKSECLNVKTHHEGSIRFDYTNSRNKFSVVFDAATDPYVGMFRVEGDLTDFKPSSIDSTYADDSHDQTLIDSIPFNQFSLSIGGSGKKGAYGGVPDWVCDKVNRIMSCDQVRIENQYYCKSEGAQWEQTRPEIDWFSAQKLTVTYVENPFSLELDNIDPSEEMTTFLKIKKFTSNTTNQTISGIFKARTKLLYLDIITKVGGTFSVTIATESTGSVDDFSLTFPCEGVINSFEIGQLFATDKTILITGVDANTTDIMLPYFKYDAPTTGTVNPYTQLGTGAVVMYDAVSPGDLAIDWDLDSGQGNNDTAWAGWRIHSIMINRFALANDGVTDQADFPLGGTGGSFTKKVTINDLPLLQFALFGENPTPLIDGGLEPYVEAGPGDVIAAQGGQLGFDQMRVGKSAAAVATIGVTNIVGGINGDGTGGVGETFDITPKYYNILYVRKEFDV